MDASHWQRIQNLFHRARKLEPARRPEFLDQACAGDLALRRELEELLSAAEDSTAYFGSPAVSDDEAEGGDEHLGILIGPYRLIRRLGEGGMGVVYLAERADGEFEQRAAVKLVRSPWLGPQLVERFLAERQILARLEHPNIARLLDGGTTALGQPYLVMEYVDGEPIDDYCERNELSTRKRLELVLKVCGAVSHAHGQLVVHRDLKPGNILVNADGVPKLLDFGIAKLMDADPGATKLTIVRGQVLTPEYASPEQVRGEPVGTASDVYSLGILLYELLAGTLPYKFDTRTPQEIEKVVCDTPPSRPSTVADRSARTASQRLRRELEGDLDTIVMTALRKKPENRYPSVAALTDDIRAYLESRPVSARPASRGYVAKKFFRRHRAGVTVSAGAALALIAGAALAVWGMLVAQSERDRTQTEALRAAQTTAFVTNMLSSIDPEYARGTDTKLMHRVLDDAVTRAPVELADQPAVLGDIQFLISDVFYRIYEFERAREVAVQAAELARRVPSDTLYLKSNMRLAEIDLAESDLESSVERVDMVLARLAERREPDDMLRAWCLIVKGNALSALARFEEAESAARELLELTDGADAPELINRRLEGLGLMGIIRLRTGRPEESYRLFERARNEALELDGTSKESQLAAALTGMGWALSEQQRFAEAEPLLREVVELMESWFGAEHLAMAMYLNNLGATLKGLGRLDEAVPLFERSLNISVNARGPGHPRNLSYMVNVGVMRREQGDVAGSVEIMQQAMAFAEEALPRDHELHAIIRIGIGKGELALGNPAAAVEPLRESVQMFTELFGPEFWRTEDAVQALAEAEAALAGQSR